MCLHRIQRILSLFLWQLLFWILAASTAILAQPPHIISTVPSPNQLDVEPTVNISATFNVDMNGASFSDSTFVVLGTQTGSHLGRIEYVNATQTVTFDPIRKFAHGEEVTVVLTSDITSSHGNSLKNYIWSFTVEAGGGGGQFDSSEVIHNEGIVSLVSVLCADLDGDEKIDVAVLGCEINSFIFILWNDGYKKFSFDYAGSLYGSRVDLSAGDMDRDGDVDLVVLETDINSIWVLSNNGDRTFTEVGPYDTGERPLSMYGNDLDGDGDTDLAVSNYYSDSLSILFNDGKGSFSNRVSLATDQEPRYLAGGDFDSDGDIDLAIAHHKSKSIIVLVNEGNGDLSRNGSYQVGTVYLTYPNDLDGDGDIDLAMSGSHIPLLVNNGDGTFIQGSPGVSFGPWSLGIGDFDGDGDIDLASANVAVPSLTVISVLFNDGDGVFSRVDSIRCECQIVSLSVGDLDSDGDLDLVTAGGGLVTVLWNEKSTPVQGPFIHDEIPDGLELSQNYPNPFNSTTAIQHSIPSKEHRAKSEGRGEISALCALRTTLKIYNVLGQEIRTLVDEPKDAGYYTVTWDGNDSQGKGVSSGVYFYCLQAGDFMQTRKMVLMR